MTQTLREKRRWFCLILTVAFLQFHFAHAQVAPIVISEILGGGGNSGSTYKNDFIELYNPSEAAVSLAGWSIQYASAAGSSWSKTDLTGSIAARGYYLIKADAGGGNGTTDLPTPDAVSTLALSASAGKVALCNNNTLLTGTAPVSAAIIDFVGYGSTAGFSEGGNAPTTNAPVPSATASIERKANQTSTAASLAPGGSDVLLGNGYDSNNNSADFVAQASENPQNSGSPAEPAAPSTDPNITVSTSSIDFGDQNLNTNSSEQTIGVTYANLTGSDVTLSVELPFSISKTAGGVFEQTLTYDLAELTGTSFTVYVRVNVTSPGSVTKSVTFAGGGDDTPPSVSLTANGVDFSVVTPINSIQGNGQTAVSGNYTIRGIVTAIYPTWSPSGYYIQSEATDDDSDPSTSEGIFVVQNNPAAAVLTGDLVQISGSVIESSAAPSYGQAVITPATYSVISHDQTLPSPVSVTMPVASATFLERYEGMLVQFAGPLTVTNNYDLGTFGSISLSQGGLVYQPTQLFDPNDATPSGTTSTGNSNMAAITALQTSNALRTVILDDGSAVTPTSLPYVDANNTLRVGSTINTVTGILGFGYSAYRIQPISDFPVVFSSASRPGSAPDVGASEIKVASFNVLNYFNGNGDGTGFPTSRGASSLNEFNRQRTKIISALSLMNADVVGLIEIENDGTGANSAVADLVNGLNAVVGADTYAYIDDASVPNTDAIRCAIIYKPAIVTPSGNVMTSNDPVFNRPPVAQNFSIVSATGRIAAANEFTYMINHFKSKGCSGASGADTDQLDGQSCYNETRKQQADALLSFVSGTITPQSGNSLVVSMGDYNAYYEEDPLDKLREGGLEVLSESTAYSYQFGGQLGSLDHAVVSTALSPAVTGVAKWNINSLEPVYLSYEDGVDDDGSGEDQVNPWASTYTSDEFRSSDHDAVLVGLNLSSALPVSLVSFSARPDVEKVVVKWVTTSETNNSHFVLERSSDGITFGQIAIIDGAGDYNEIKNYQYDDLNPIAGTSFYRLRQFDFDGASTLSRIVSVQHDPAAGLHLTVSPNPVKSMLKLDISGLDNQAVLRYEVVNGTGYRVVSGEGTIAHIDKEINTILPGITPGIYLIKAESGVSSFMFRFVKQ